jgi:alpha-glucosidase
VALAVLPVPDGRLRLRRLGPLRLPTNWLSNFGGSAWTWDEQRGAWYYHAYLPEQPDLDWRNPEVSEAMLGVLRFWVELGADGFRVDALRHTIKDDRWRDNPTRTPR